MKKALALAFVAFNLIAPEVQANQAQEFKAFTAALGKVSIATTLVHREPAAGCQLLEEAVPVIKAAYINNPDSGVAAAGQTAAISARNLYIINGGCAMHTARRFDDNGAPIINAATTRYWAQACLNEHVVMNLKSPGSLQYVSHVSRMDDDNNTLHLTVDYSATNGYGGRVRDTQRCTKSFS
jgi:hypothetical protein